MALTQKTINGTLTPIGSRVIVKNMHFGEQTTKSGLIIRDDNGTSRGIYPRWGQVHALGPKNEESYSVDDWVLVSHGRWTRSVTMDDGAGEQELRMVDESDILMYSTEKPDGVYIGEEV